jgi:hypothetical protein
MGGDLVAASGSDDAGFFEIELVEPVADGGALSCSERGVGEAGGDVLLSRLAEAVGVGEQGADLVPDGGFELFCGEVAGSVGASFVVGVERGDP